MMSGNQHPKQPTAIPFEPITRDNLSKRMQEAATALELPLATVEELFQTPDENTPAPIQDLRNAFFSEDGCNAGNDALRLDNFKRNIAVNLQTFAQMIYNNHAHKLKESRDEFNRVFNLIAVINNENLLELAEDFQQHCSQLTLEELQASLESVYLDKFIIEIAGTTRTASLLSLNRLNHLSTVQIVDDKVYLTVEIEKSKARRQQAIVQAARIKDELARLQAAAQKPSGAIQAPVPPAEAGTNKKDKEDVVEAETTESAQHTLVPIDHDNAGSSTGNQSEALLPESKESQRFWQTPMFKKTLAGIGLFLSICLLGAGIAFSGGALGAGLIIGGLALMGVSALISVYSEKISADSKNNTPLYFLPLHGCFGTTAFLRNTIPGKKRGAQHQQNIDLETGSTSQILAEGDQHSMHAGSTNTSAILVTGNDQRRIRK